MFADKVRVLGVAPIIVDADSDIKHPQKDQILTLVADLNRKYKQQLIRKLKETGNFHTDGIHWTTIPRALFGKLFSRREKRDDATILYNKYFWKNDELRDYIQKNNLDAVMLLVVSGLSKPGKIYSSNLLKSLSSDYNYLTMTAQILNANGDILWEYPNFRGRLLTYYPMINLQYPDFDEAEANLSTAADIKFKTINGIKLTLDQKRKDLLMRETAESQVYGKQFDEMLSIIKYEPDGDKKGKNGSADDNSKPAEKPIAPVKETQNAPGITKPAVTPAAESSRAAVPESTKVPIPDKPKEPAPLPAPSSDEIVPATESTL